LEIGKEEFTLVETISQWKELICFSNFVEKGLGDLQGVNEIFLFAEKGIQRFDESRFKGGEMKWSASSSENLS